MNGRSRTIGVVSGGVALMLLLLIGHGFSAADGASKAETVFRYEGAKKCKMCHKLPKYGAQYQVWEDSKHAKAYRTLKTEKANEIARELGHETPAVETPACLECHTTAYGEPDEVRGKKLSHKEGVSCEACHGPGSEFAATKTMKKIAAGEVDGASFGLVIPDEETCRGCHNEKSPTFKGFDWDEYWAEIYHEKAPTTPGD